MKRRTLVVLWALIGLGAVGLWLRQSYWNDHMRRMSGQKSLAGVTCFHCHLVSTNQLAWAQPRPRHDSPAGIVVSPDGTRLFIALDDRDQVAEVDAGSRAVLRRVSISGRPFGLALDPSGRSLFVTCRDADRLAVLDTQSMKETAASPAGMGPVGVVYCATSSGGRVLVANSMSDDVSVFSVSPLKELARPAAGREPFALAVGADGRRVFVANRMVQLAEVGTVPMTETTEIDPVTGRVLARERLESAHLSEGISGAPGRGWVLTPIVKVRNLVPITQAANGWVMSSGLGILDPATREVVQVPLDEANDHSADPSGVAVNATRAFVASGGGDVVSVVDLDRLARWMVSSGVEARAGAIDDLSLSPEYVTARIPTGRNPRQVTLSPDGRTLFVAERLQDTVLVVDAETLVPRGRVVLGDGGSGDPIRRGERVFTKSSYTFQHQFSCRSCHPDGHVDGLSYDFDGDGIGDNFLDNRSLLGVAGTAPFKWNGKNPSLEIQCGPRFAKVLMRTEPFPDRQLQDLTTFIQSQPPQRVRSAAGGQLTASQERGRAIFFATATPSGKPIPHERRCSTCHRPPLFTVRLPFDVGTRGARDTSDGFDTPQLLGVADTAPYLHDGRALSLEEIWTLYNPDDRHGVTSHMNKIQLNDLIEFLKTL